MLNLPPDTPQQQGLLSSLIAKVINNLQVTVKNIHVRYEDKLSVPGVCLSLRYLREPVVIHSLFSIPSLLVPH